MTGILVMAFAILVALALGFVTGRIWQIRRDELDRRTSFTVPPIARIPFPRGAQPGEISPDSAERLNQSNTAGLFRT
jgi:hypothetical protein